MMTNEPKDIDVFIPPRKPDFDIDLEVPKQNEKVYDENVIESSIKDIAETANVAAEVSSNATRLILKYIQAGEKLTGVFEKELEQLKSEGKTDRKQAALAIDLEVGLLLKRVDIVSKKLSKSLANKQPDSALAQEAESIIQKIHDLKEERAADEPNQVVELAKALGVDESLAIVNPFGALEEKLALAIIDDLARQRIISAIEKMGGPTKEIKDFLSHAKLQDNVKKYGKRAAMAGGAVGLMMVLSGWFAMKMESAKRQ